MPRWKPPGINDFMVLTIFGNLWLQGVDMIAVCRGFNNFWLQGVEMIKLAWCASKPDNKAASSVRFAISTARQGGGGAGEQRPPPSSAPLLHAMSLQQKKTIRKNERPEKASLKRHVSKSERSGNPPQKKRDPPRRAQERAPSRPYRR